MVRPFQNLAASFQFFSEQNLQYFCNMEGIVSERVPIVFNSRIGPLLFFKKEEFLSDTSLTRSVSLVILWSTWLILVSSHSTVILPLNHVI